MQQRQLVLNLTPVNINNELAKLNQAILHPDIYNKLRGNGQAVYIRIKEYILTCNKSSEVPQDKVGLNKKTREYIYVSMTEPIPVTVYQIPIDRETSLADLQFQVQLQNPQPSYFEVDDVKLTEILRKSFTNTFFKAKQVFYITYENQLLVLVVQKTELMQTGTSSVIVENDGRLVSMTQVRYSIKVGDKIRLKNDQSGSQNLFKADFQIADMGIGGLDDELTNIFRRAFASRRFPQAIVEKFGIKHIKGILLFGPPGTGKTLIARQLAKVLKAKQLTIVNGPEIFSRYVGESEQNIRKLFKKAREDEQSFGDQSPLHIIVFDEIDAICKQRGSNNSGSNAPDLVVNQLLTNIDGVESLNNILVIGMTNRKDLIDQAILRPGRFQVHIEVGLPNEEGRQQILKIHTKDLTKNQLLDVSVNLPYLAENTKNFTGAEIQALVKSASSFCMSRSYDIMNFEKEIVVRDNVKVTMEDFQQALTEVKPQFGVDEEKFGVFMRGKLYDYGKRFYNIMKTLDNAIDITKNGKNTALNSILIEGDSGTGKTSIAAHFAKKCSFPYVKLISPETFVGYSDVGKIMAIKKIFDDAYRSKEACIIVDNLERILEFVDIGPRFNNHLLQTLLVLLRKLPQKSDCRLLLIGTTSMYDKLLNLEVPQCFNSKVSVPLLNFEQIYKILTVDLLVNPAEANEVAKFTKNCSIQRFIQIKDMANGKGMKAWKEAWDAFSDFTM